MNRCRHCDCETDKTFCSQECRATSWKKVHYCLFCGERFTEHEPDTPTGFCSFSCRTMNRSVQKIVAYFLNCPIEAAKRQVIATVVAQAGLLPMEVWEPEPVNPTKFDVMEERLIGRQRDEVGLAAAQEARTLGEGVGERSGPELRLVGDEERLADGSEVRAAREALAHG